MVWTATTLPLPVSIIREFLIFQRCAYIIIIIIIIIIIQVWNIFIYNDYFNPIVFLVLSCCNFSFYLMYFFLLSSLFTITLLKLPTADY